MEEEISLISYDEEDKNHCLVVRQMLEDSKVEDRTGSLIQNVLYGEEEAFLIAVGDKVVGAIDFNLYKSLCYVSLRFASNYRYHGYGTKALDYVKDYVFEQYSDALGISLRIESDNDASIKSAINAGYEKVETQDKKNVRYDYTRESHYNTNNKSSSK